MKIYLVMVSILLMGGLVMADPPKAEVLKKELGAVLQAPYLGKGELILKHSHSNLVDLLGGKKTFLESIAQLEKILKEGGVTFGEAKIGEPYSYQKTKEREYFLVDVLLTLKKGGEVFPNELTQFVVKDTNDETWRFIDTNGLNDEIMRKLFPDIPKKFTLPGDPKVVEVPDDLKIDQRFIGTWRGERTFTDPEQIYRWRIERKADGSFSVQSLEYYPTLKVYLSEELEGRWGVKEGRYFEIDQEEEPSHWKIGPVAKNQIKMQMFIEGELDEVADIENRTNEKADKFLTPPGEYRKVTPDQLDELL